MIGKKKILQRDKCIDIPLEDIKECNADDVEDTIGHSYRDPKTRNYVIEHDDPVYKIGFKMADGKVYSWGYDTDKDARDKDYKKIMVHFNETREYIKI
jgi:hypothetical protein